MVAAVDADVKWFLNAGTIWQNYISDSENYCPVNLYAATKQAFIDIAKYYTEISDLRFCTLKLCDTYGPNDTRRKIVALLRYIADTGEALDMSSGEQYIDLVYIDDVINAFSMLMAMLDMEDNVKDEYFISSKTCIKLKELAMIYEKLVGKKININWGKKKYRQREVMIPWKAGCLLPNWIPMINIEKGLMLLNKIDVKI